MYWLTVLSSKLFATRTCSSAVAATNDSLMCPAHRRTVASCSGKETYKPYGSYTTYKSYKSYMS